MDAGSPRAALRGGPEASVGSGCPGLSKNSGESQRTPGRILIEDWGRRTAVTIWPRSCDRPSLCFKSPEDALRFARELAVAEGLPIIDRRDDGRRTA